MRVALVSFDLGEYTVRLANALAPEAKVLLLLAREAASPYHLSLLDKSLGFQPFDRPRLRQPVRQLWMISAVLRHIRRFNPDVIHLQRGHLWFNFALPLLRRYPLVLTIHDPRHHVGDMETRKTPQIVMDFGARRAHQVIVHAKQLKQAVVEQLQMPAAKVHVVPHIAVGGDVVQHSVCEEEHLILFFGRIWEYKGLEYLIRAEPAITTQVPDVKIVIAGAGEDFDRYQRMMIHPERFVVYNEYISDEKRAELFQRASLVVLPYIDASQSGVIPVAYSFAKPVVATTVGGLPEAVDHGRTGYLVPPRDEKALAGAIIDLLRDRELRRQLGMNGKRMSDREYSPEVVARRTLAVYHCALNGGGAGE